MTGIPRVFRNDWSTIAVPEIGGWSPTMSVSVIVPARNCQQSLDLLLASLTQQTYPVELLDVVVVDDGSLPRLELPPTRPVRTRLLRAADHGAGTGIANACNVAAGESTGEVIVRLDADMVVFPRHVEAHARWHHAISYAVTLGTKRFVDVQPGGPGWPPADALVRAGTTDGLFERSATRPHEYVERIIDRTDRLRAADHLAFCAYVGATTAMRRQMFDAAGGFDAGIERGEDTEFGYRLAQSGAVFVPEPRAESWHLGLSTMMRNERGLQRGSRPYLADVMPHPRWLRKVGGTRWAVPLVTVVVEVRSEPLEIVRATVDSLLRSDETDLSVLLVGPWTSTNAGDRPTHAFPPDLRLIAATYRSEPRVKLIEQVPATVFPSPYLLELPVTAVLSPSAIPIMLAEADREQAGLVNLSRTGVRLWRTSARSRARWVGEDDDAVADLVAVTHGVRTLPADAVGMLDLTDVDRDSLSDGYPRVRAKSMWGWHGQVVEVGGVRSWIRATAFLGRVVVARLMTATRRRVARRYRSLHREIYRKTMRKSL